MTGAAREKDQADFDLERFIEMFDEALTSRDPRVVNALRSVMMMTILTKSETYGSLAQDRNSGPLRRLYEDVNHMNRRMHDMQMEIKRLSVQATQAESWTAEKYWSITQAVKMAQENIGEDMLQGAINKINRPVANLGPEQKVKGPYIQSLHFLLANALS